MDLKTYKWTSVNLTTSTYMRNESIVSMAYDFYNEKVYAIMNINVYGDNKLTMVLARFNSSSFLEKVLVNAPNYYQTYSRNDAFVP